VLCHPLLSKYENIIKLFNFNFSKDYNDCQFAWPVFAIEYADYDSLDDYRQNIMLDNELIRELFFNIVLNFDTFYSYNIIYGDIKLKNILIYRYSTRNVMAKLSDFRLIIINLISDSLHHLSDDIWPWAAPEFHRRLFIENF
jgi:hypothetical protein